MTGVPSEKACTKCSAIKPITDFHRNGGRRRASCKSCESMRNAARREANPDYMAEWRKANPDYMADYMAEWTAANPDYMADYRAANPEVAWLGGYRRRARRFGFEPIVEDFTKADVIELYGDQCWHCKDAPFEELDHHPIPVAAEGPHTIENVKPSCTRCNRAGTQAARAMREELLAAAAA